MIVADYVDILTGKEPPNYFIICASDTEMRLVYLNLFCDAHKCGYRYVDSIDFKNRTRTLGKKEVLVLTDFKPVLENPSELYTEYNKPVVFCYTSPKGITKAVEQFYDKRVLIMNEITRDQARFILAKKGLATPAIQYLCENVANPTHVRRYGLQMLSLCNDLNISQQECFETYFKAQLRADVSEDPEPFFQAILTRNFAFVAEYIRQQSGNEFYVYASIFRWFENLIRFKASNGDYWNKGKLVKAIYSNYQHNDWRYLSVTDIMNLYSLGCRYRDNIKNSERDPITALEVYVCYIIRTLILKKVI